MRCDNCPLCPIAEDDVCLESEDRAKNMSITS